MVTSAKRAITKENKERCFEALWLKQVPLLVKGLTESEYLVFENMFEMFADLRELAACRLTAVPSLEYTFDRSVQMCLIKKNHCLDKQLVVERFREALKFAKIPEERPNRYAFRQKLRTMGCQIFFLMRDSATDKQDLLKA